MGWFQKGHSLLGGWVLVARLSEKVYLIQGMLPKIVIKNQQ